MLKIVRINRDKETKEETYVPFFVYKKDIASLYKDRTGVYIVTKQSFLNKVPYTLEEVEEMLEL